MKIFRRRQIIGEKPNSPYREQPPKEPGPSFMERHRATIIKTIITIVASFLTLWFVIYAISCNKDFELKLKEKQEQDLQREKEVLAIIPTMARQWADANGHNKSFVTARPNSTLADVVPSDARQPFIIDCGNGSCKLYNVMK